MNSVDLEYPSSRFYWLGLALFWLVVFLINAGPHWESYSSGRELIETAGMKTALQMLVAVITIGLLIPRFLSEERWLVFIGLWFVTVVIASEINIVIRVLYLEPLYPDSYRRFLELFSHMTLSERMDLRWAMRYILYTKVTELSYPTVLIAAYKFYQRQQVLLQLKEQKKSAELDALKNQLNPHFIFNTLNNIYALSLKKSDQTPMAVEKLSSILDYVVYRCNDKFVDLDSEIALIENYIALEKIRYGNRLQFTLKTELNRQLKIAPLVLLTLLENACKHGIREELNQANIDMTINQKLDGLEIIVSNTKPSMTHSENSEGKVGLDNLRKQLQLLYPGTHHFDIKDNGGHFIATLTLERLPTADKLPSL